jgi:cation diffusion facilitator CzcD-associated flavoprotein CzcO
MRVTSVEQLAEGKGHLGRTEETIMEARNVVIATGLFQRLKLPFFSAGLPIQITQLHSGDCRNPQSLPPGAVLVVWSAQSGCQIPRRVVPEWTQGLFMRRKCWACSSSVSRQGHLRVAPHEGVRAFAGENHEVAVVPPKARTLLSRFDARSQHYEVKAEMGDWHPGSEELF